MFLFASLGSALPTSGSPDPRGFDAITSSALVLPPAPHFKTGPGHPQSLQVPYVTSTLVLPNDSLVAGNFNAVNPVNPSGAVYDSGTGQLYVADSSSGNVSVINAATGEVVAGIRVGAEPFEMAYDRGKGEIFVTNYGQGTVSVISDRNDTVVATVPVGTEPDGVAYDSATGDVYVANGNSSQNTGGLGNVSVISDTNNTVVATITVGTCPADVAYDNGTGQMWVDDACSNNVTVLSGSNNTVEANISLPSGPDGIAYDFGRGEMFVSTAIGSKVYVISDTNYSILGSVGSGGWPMDMTYDNETGEVIVACSAGNDVSIISDVTNQVLVNGSWGLNPFGAAFDPATGVAFVVNAFSYNVTMISGRSNSAIGTVWLGDYPDELAYDSGKSEIFVTNPGWFGYVQGPLRGPEEIQGILSATNSVMINVSVRGQPQSLAYDSESGEIFVTTSSKNVSVVSDTTNALVANIDVGYGSTGVAYDNRTGELFVTNYESNNVTVINGSTNTLIANIPVGGSPIGVVYDNGTGQVFVTLSSDARVKVISPSNNSVVETIRVGSAPYSEAYDSAKGEIFVSDEGTSNVSVISDLTYDVVATIPVGPSPQGLAYDPGTGEILVANSASDTVSVISDLSNSVLATVKVGSFPTDVVYDPTNQGLYVADSNDGCLSILSIPAETYTVTFSETGLPEGSNWSITVNGTSWTSGSNALSFLEPNGTFEYNISAAGTGFYSTTSPGSFTVRGAKVIEVTGFVLPRFPVSFTESGLPSGTKWSVTLGAVTNWSTTTSVGFSEQNGTYNYTTDTEDTAYAPERLVGSITVDGAAEREEEIFVSAALAINFAETGLPAGTNWYISIEDHQVNSSTSHILVIELNGSYDFAVSSVTGYTPNPSAGYLTVSGSPVSVSIAFTPIVYALTFMESGLPVGTNWSVEVSDWTFYSTAPEISLREPNGTYDYRVGPVSGFGASTTNSVVTVDGAPMDLSVTFSSSSTPASGLTTSDYSAGVLGVALLVILPTILLKRRQGKRLPRQRRQP
jgi:YVTN family beta-propeller protein